MVQTIGQLLPLAVGVALSSIPIMVTLTMLLSPDSGPSSLTFLIGWVLGMFAVVGLLALGANQIPHLGEAPDLPWLASAQIVLGLALLFYGVISFARRRDRPPQAELPRWLTAIGTVRPVPAFGLAIALCLRPKALLISTAAALIVASSRLTPGASVVALVIFVAIGAATVLVPVILTLARPQATRPSLESAERWIAANSHTVTFIAIVVTAVVIVGHGMTQL